MGAKKIYLKDNTGAVFAPVTAWSAVKSESGKTLDETVGVFNVDAHYPLKDGTFYTHDTAVEKVPVSVQHQGLIITYKTDETTIVNEQCISTAWSKEAKDWKKVGGSDIGDAKLFEENQIRVQYGHDSYYQGGLINTRYTGQLIDIAENYVVSKITFSKQRISSVVQASEITINYWIASAETEKLVSKGSFVLPSGQHYAEVNISVPAHCFLMIQNKSIGADSVGNTVNLYTLKWVSGGENLKYVEASAKTGTAISNVGSYLIVGVLLEYGYTSRKYLNASEVSENSRKIEELSFYDEKVQGIEWVSGGIVADSSLSNYGEKVTNYPNKYFCTGKIACKGYISVTTQLPTSDNVSNQKLGIVFYNSADEPISSSKIKAFVESKSTNEVTLDIPSDAEYFRTTALTTDTEVVLRSHTKDAIANLYDDVNELSSFDRFPSNTDYEDKVGLLKKVSTKSKLLCWFSDLHADTVRLSRILAFCKYYGVGDILFTGDLVELNHTEDIAWWAGTGAQNVPITIGNHDVWGDGKIDVTQKMVYEKFIAPYVDNWGVVQPDGAAENALCYYYKDYSANKLRVIVVDDQFKPESQTEWLKGVLSNAKIQGLRVIIATHGYPEATSTPTLDTPFDTNRGMPNNWYPIPSVVEAVKTFIDDGGMFVCWLTGHAHYNYARLLDGDNRQLCLSVANAGLAVSVKGQGYRNEKGLSQDQFDILGISDTSLFVARIGCDMEFTRGKAVTMAWNYVEHKLLY